ncbi:MAG: cytochrome ubiquinol oxidase subunit I [Candidatus Delongbacteria bacterium]|nr:cytochrome ubiquinol oxidase subunit I [Candidatus Delongbacteria bacterium]MBN2835277.1 cytochrome ubiquinol oxidase subunit I [Candidatus Delongbacteria bacterium]
MEAVLLARLQFVLTISFHYIFPPLTFGVSLLIAIFLGMNLKTGKQLYDDMAKFWTKIFLIIFTVGVASGIVMEFQFGTNWEAYSRFVGDIFGAPLAIEGVFAFFLESTFLGVLIFGRNKVSKKFYFFSALMVVLGSTMSAFWIIVANSWQQTPAGYQIVDVLDSAGNIIGKRAELIDFFAAVFNPSTLPRFFHAVVGGWIAGSFLIAALSSWYLLKKRNIEFAKNSLKIALIVALFSSLTQVMIGHWHAVVVAKHQPVKLAAMEGLFETQKNAPLSLIGIPNAETKQLDYEISIPGLLSFLIDFDTDYEVKGLNDYDESLHPPLFLTFTSYHIMVGLGMLFILFPLIGLYLIWKNKIENSDLFNKLMLSMLILPTMANQLGWMAAEVGRQPWVVQGELKTADAISKVVSSGEILTSIIIFGILYLFLGILFVYLVAKKVRKGPEALIITK